MATPSPTSPADPSAPVVRALRVWQRFHIRLTAVYGGLVIGALSCLGVVMYLRGVRAEETSLKNRMRAVAVATAEGIDPLALDRIRTPEDVGNADHAKLMSHFKLVCAADPDITDIYVLRRGPSDTVLAFIADYVAKGEAPPAVPGEEYDTKEAPNMLLGFTEPAVDDEITTDQWGPSLSAYAPVFDADGKARAVVGVDAAASGLERMRYEVLVATVTLYGLAGLLLALLTIGVGRNVREPLSRIIEATSALAGGRLSVRAGFDRDDEFGIMGEHFDQMAAGLEEREKIRGLFGRYVSPEVARRAMSQQGSALGGEEREVMILFSDLRGYSTISEKLSPPELIGLLNDYLSAMQELIDREGGCVIEFLGDAILAAFGAPNDLPDHPARAVRCALAMREELVKLNEKWDAAGISRVWKQAGIEKFAARIGIHTGKVVAGNLGSATRVKYATLGDAVTLANKIETLNGPIGTDLLCTAAVMDRLPDDLKAKAVAKGEHAIKGRDLPVTVFTFS